MGIPVLVLGESGSGKSTSMRNFDKSEVCVLNVAGKRLPFRGNLDIVNNANYSNIGKTIKEGKFKRYVIDDSQYLLAFELFDRVKETGYGKFTDIAVRFRNMISYVASNDVPEDTVVYFLHHTDLDDRGRTKAKTVGKMLDNQLTVEGLFSIVLLCIADGSTHKFITQSDGTTCAKSPMGMLPLEMDNDLKAVDTAIREYWNLNN